MHIISVPCCCLFNLYFLDDNLVQRTMVEMIKIVATMARDAMTIKHCFTLSVDEQGWEVVLGVVSGTLVRLGALVGNVLVITGIHPPCVAFVVDMLENAVVWLGAPVVD